MNGTSPSAGRKRVRESDPPPEFTENDSLEDSASLKNAVENEELGEEIQENSQPTTRVVKRNFDKVNFGHWQIKTWYFCSPLTSF